MSQNFYHQYNYTCYINVRTFTEVTGVAQWTLAFDAARTDVCAVCAIFTRSIGTEFQPCCP